MFGKKRAIMGRIKHKIPGEQVSNEFRNRLVRRDERAIQLGHSLQILTYENYMYGIEPEHF